MGNLWFTDGYVDSVSEAKAVAIIKNYIKSQCQSGSDLKLIDFV